jgi:hypothetical protein
MPQCAAPWQIGRAPSRDVGEIYTLGVSLAACFCQKSDVLKRRKVRIRCGKIIAPLLAMFSFGRFE